MTNVYDPRLDVSPPIRWSFRTPAESAALTRALSVISARYRGMKPKLCEQCGSVLGYLHQAADELHGDGRRVDEHDVALLHGAVLDDRSALSAELHHAPDHGASDQLVAIQVDLDCFETPIDVPHWFFLPQSGVATRL